MKAELGEGGSWSFPTVTSALSGGPEESEDDRGGDGRVGDEAALLVIGSGAFFPGSGLSTVATGVSRASTTLAESVSTM